MKKILVVTCYCAYNYGAYWQAMALKKFLKQYNYDVHFLKIDEKLFFEREIKNSYTSKIIKVLEQKHKEFNLINQNESNERLFDCIILGSDEIWNLDNPVLKQIRVFWGIGLRAKKVISYSPSVGSSGIKVFLKNPRRIIALRKLDAISVRDDNSERLISVFRKRNQTLLRTLDPTFLVSYDDISPAALGYKYVFCYTYGFSDSVVSEIKEFAQRKGYKIVVTGSECFWADYNPVLSPEEWIAYFKSADYVITNTFHGTVFSIIFNKTFSIISSNSDKVKSLIKEFGIENCDFEKEHSFMESKVNYTKINEQLINKICFSKKYLENELI